MLTEWFGMNTDALFIELEPPPGGAERFKRRLDALAAASPSPRVRGFALVAAGAAGVLVAAILLVREPGDAPQQPVADAAPAVDVYGAREFDRLLGRASPPAELMVVVNAQPARVTEIQTSNEKVRIYRIDEPPPAAPQP
jgi:hypothetical protein